MAIFKDGVRERIEGIGELGDGRTIDNVDISGIKLNSMPSAADGEITLNDQNVTNAGTIKLGEQAAAEADTAAYGQLWVKTATPNELYFTNDAGNDIQITSGTGMAGGSVAADDITEGDAAVTLGTSSGDVTVDAAGAVNITSDTGDVVFQDGGVDQLSIDMDSVAGEVIIQNKVDGDDLVFKQYDGTEVIRFTDAGNAEVQDNFYLKSDNSALVMGADGDVTFNHTHNLGVTLSLATSTQSRPLFVLKNRGDFTEGPGFVFIIDNGAGEADDDIIGFLRFDGDDSADASGDGAGGTQYGKLEVISSDVTDGDEGGQFKFKVQCGGSVGTANLQEVFSVGGEDVANGRPCEVTVNDIGSGFIDFRAETDNQTHALFVDASADAVGINNSSPSKELDVVGDALVTSSATTTDSVGVVANSLTTGSALVVSSSSTNTSARNMVEISNSASAATGSTGLHISSAAQPSFGMTTNGTITFANNVHQKTDSTGQTLAVTEFLNAMMIRTGVSSGNYTDTTPTAANIVGGVPNASQGMVFEFSSYNGTAHQQKIAGGTGVVMLNGSAADFTISAGEYRNFKLFITNTSGGSEQLYMVPIDQGSNPNN